MAEPKSNGISTEEHELESMLPASEACTSQQSASKMSQEDVVRRRPVCICSKKFLPWIMFLFFMLLTVLLLVLFFLFKDIHSENQDSSVPHGTFPPQNVSMLSCGNRSRTLHPGIDIRVSGGHPTSIESWPWMASMRDMHGIHFCGATLISDRWLLTAAHCVSSIQSRPLGTVVMGDTVLSSPSDYHVAIETFDIFVHPHYESATFAHDIALIKFEPGIRPTEGVSPACLNDETDEIDVYSNCFIVGWGATSPADIRSNDLQVGRVPLVPIQNCSAAYASRHIVTADMLCAVAEEGRVDTCKGDSGGPLMCEHSATNDWYVVGVTSFGFGCWNPGDPAPSVYTRVSSYYSSFIKDTMNNHDGR